MLSISSSTSLFNTFNTKNNHKDSTFPSFSTTKPQFSNNPFHISKNPLFCPKNLHLLSPKTVSFIPKSADFDSEEAETSAAATTAEEDEWLSKLPDKKKPLYAHSLPCIEAWLKSLGFYQSRDDRAVWLIEKHDWHAQLSLDVTDLYIRYLKNGPGNLEKDMERRFSYALSREDIENAVLGGP
ncbi:hypothetical protein RND81_O264600 [Saponaria officinalis]|uniref:Uncharacterized protein n=1 Tax=Saponaria officinalis TaxID=3572 RepID=A0AAW1GJ52_SAPOF